MGALVRRSFSRPAGARQRAHVALSGQAPQHAYQQGGRAPIPAMGQAHESGHAKCLPHPSRRRAEEGCSRRARTDRRAPSPGPGARSATALLWRRRLFGGRHLLVAALAQRQHRASRARGSLSSKRRAGLSPLLGRRSPPARVWRGAEHAIRGAIPEAAARRSRAVSRNHAETRMARPAPRSRPYFSAWRAGSRLQREAAPARVCCSGEHEEPDQPAVLVPEPGTLARASSVARARAAWPGGRLAQPGGRERKPLPRHPAKPDEPRLRGKRQDAGRAQGIPARRAFRRQQPAMADTGGSGRRARSAMTSFLIGVAAMRGRGQREGVVRRWAVHPSGAARQ